MLVQVGFGTEARTRYAHHITDDPYARHLDECCSFVWRPHAANCTEVLARTIGASLRMPALDPERSPDAEPFWGIPQIAELPFAGSALVPWDFGTPASPVDNEPNRAGADPHIAGASVPQVRLMVDAFLQAEGELIDVCAGEPCRTLPPSL